jgi:hypothetical protein
LTSHLKQQFSVQKKIKLDPDSNSDGESNRGFATKEYSNSHSATDIDSWDLRAGRVKSLTFSADDAEFLDGQIREITVIDEIMKPL